MKALYLLAPVPELVVPASALVALALASLMNLTLEVPVTRWLRNWYRAVRE